MRIVVVFRVMLILLIMMSSCKRIDGRLLRAEAFMETCPDSALSILVTIDNPQQGLSKDNYALYTMLEAQAMYKCYLDISENNQINYAVDYFRNSSDSTRAGKAFLYAGRVAYDSKNTLQAVEYYLQACDFLQGNSDAKYQYLARIYLGELYSSQWLHEEHLNACEDALHYALEVDSFYYQAWAYHEAGIALIAMDSLDKALAYQSIALSLAQEYKPSLVFQIYYQLCLLTSVPLKLGLY